MSKKRKQPATHKSTPNAVAAGISPQNLGIFLGLLAFALYANTLGHGYVLDDDLALSLHENVRQGLSGIGAIFMEPYRANCFGGCLYRPLTLSTFALEWTLAPNSPGVGHFFNVLWFSGTVLLLFHTSRRLLTGFPLAVPVALSLLFACHPIHTEVVANIKSRDEILSAFFVLLSLYLFAKKDGRFSVGAGFAFLAALLSKEGAITALVVFPLAGWTFFKQPIATSLKNSAGFLVPALLFFLLRGAAISGLTEPATSIVDNPIVGASGFAERFGTAFSVLFEYFRLLLWPFELVSDYTYNTFPLRTLSHPTALMGLLLSAGVGIWSLWKIKDRNPIAFSGLVFLASLSLYSQLLLVIGTLLGERLLFTPSIWFVFGLVLLLASLFKLGSSEQETHFQWSAHPPAARKLLYAIGAISIVFAFLTIQRNKDWKDNLSLFRADVAKSPNSVRLNDGYAEQLYRQLQQPNLKLTALEIQAILDTSEVHSQKSLEIKPGVSAYNNLGNLANYRRQYAQAVDYYKKALEVVPNYSYAKINLANSLQAWAMEEGEKKNNPDRARELLHESLEYQPDNANAYHLIGISYGVQGKHLEAIEMFEKAYALDPGNANIKRDLVTAYTASGQIEKARAIDVK